MSLEISHPYIATPKFKADGTRTADWYKVCDVCKREPSAAIHNVSHAEADESLVDAIFPKEPHQ